MKTLKLKGPEQRPKDGQVVVYLFEPFDAWFIGRYDAECDSVGGTHGFTTWVPEVAAWFPQRKKY